MSENIPVKISRHFRNLEKNRARNRSFVKIYYFQVRNQVITILGGKCAMCGFNDTRALHIDHINGGGTKENHKFGPQRYVNYVKTNCEGLQLLCANCNMIKKAENKEYPFRRSIIV
jgi:predicted restriction endonuclease